MSRPIINIFTSNSIEKEFIKIPYIGKIKLDEVFNIIIIEMSHEFVQWFLGFEGMNRVKINTSQLKLEITGDGRQRLYFKNEHTRNGGLYYIDQMVKII